MPRSKRAPAPAGPQQRPAGVAVFSGAALLSLTLLLPACDRGPFRREVPEPTVLQLDSGSVTLPDSVRLVEVSLDRTDPADLKPVSAQVHAGDIVRFAALDAGGHAIAFDGAVLAPEALAFMESTGQLRSPPLVSAGNAWVVSFRGAPPGDYPYTCSTHGARGMVRVR